MKILKKLSQNKMKRVKNLKDNITKQMTEEKDKLNLEYKQKLNNIKQHYNIEFEVDYFKNEEIKEIVFYDLCYKNILDNVSITYETRTKKMEYISFEYNDIRSIKALNHKKLIPTISKNYKLRMVVAEIERVNADYLYQLNEINKLINSTPEKVVQDENFDIRRKSDQN